MIIFISPRRPNCQSNILRDNRRSMTTHARSTRGRMAGYLSRQYKLPSMPIRPSGLSNCVDRAWHFRHPSTATACVNISLMRSRGDSLPATSSPKSGRYDGPVPGSASASAFQRPSGSMIIAIDGPAASGKGTLGKRLAAAFGLPHLDTGLLYRAVAKALLDARPAALDDAVGAIAAARRARPRPDSMKRRSRARDRRGGLGRVGDPGGARGADGLSSASSPAQPPGAVLDGRDIGTVIAPGADGEDLRHRDAGGARRAPRCRKCAARGETVNEKDVLADILRRDERDTRRTDRPAQARARRALARYHAFGYRRRIPGRRRYRRGRPNGPKARLTALSSLEVQPVRALRCAVTGPGFVPIVWPWPRPPAMTGGRRAFGIRHSIPRGLRSVHGSSC